MIGLCHTTPFREELKKYRAPVTDVSVNQIFFHVFILPFEADTLVWCWWGAPFSGGARKV